METWIYGGNLPELILKLDIDRYYQAMSWYALLSGYGIFPEQHQLVEGSAKAHKHDLLSLDKFITACASNFPPHRQLLPHAILS